MNLTEEEEIIYVSLTEGEHLQRDTVENILSPWWNKEPYRYEIDLMHNDVTRLDAREECWS
jgi:hypothetical protein